MIFVMYLKVTKFSNILNLAILVFLLNLVHAKPAKCLSINYMNSQIHEIAKFCMYALIFAIYKI